MYEIINSEVIAGLSKSVNFQLFPSDCITLYDCFFVKEKKEKKWIRNHGLFKPRKATDLYEPCMRMFILTRKKEV